MINKNTIKGNNRMHNLRILLFIGLVTFLLLGCTVKNQDSAEKIVTNTKNEEKETNKKSEIKKNNIINYDNFTNIFNDLNKNLDVDGFKLKDSTIGIDITTIEKDLTFNSREWLTIDGVMSDSPKSTQETLFLENEDSSILLTLILSYTDSYIGEDMLYYKIDSDYKINVELADSTDLVTVSYKNLVITVLQTAEGKKDFEVTKSVLRETIKYLKNY